MLEESQQSSVVTELKTVFDMVRWLASSFNHAEVYFGHGTDNSWDEAYSLVYQALGLHQAPNAQVDNARLLEEEKLRIFDWAIQRINEQKPLAYITNTAWFCDFPFYVDERVLVPRSPLAELIQSQFFGYIESQPQRILDLCTGSGCIAIACAHQFPEAEVDALDLSQDALNICEINVEQHGLWQRVFPIQSDVFSAVSGQKYDLIVSNPPYVDQEDMEDLPNEFRHEPEMGLAAGEDGLDIVRTILRQGADHLTDDGVLIVEVGNSQVHIEANFPDVEFNWIEFKNGGHGVFSFTRAELISYQASFSTP
ncbi:50S ribosomal protein L3 N(5)-glutamine methyltransferase [Gayadomonas joobiniege]|uniref:50S ribosomal protein L3 N(5)-glutamine methyltransferase n=1 Tax=Gayadomonas joobiniege TaxID=1234606 RepID=UPI000381BA0C|nr:50S ribosomal protein L3 N(5)-glutamine methyltransferase [Gayadomonas joobiniege]